MNNKKILAGALIFILLMLLFRNSRNYGYTTTKVVSTHPYYNRNVRSPNPNSNPYKAQYYN